jgi:hypothetical protein
MISVERGADGMAEAVARVAVGVRSEVVRVPLGRRSGQVDPGGLRGAPVVVLTAGGLEPLAREGAVRAGRATVAAVDPAGEPLGAALLDAASTAEVLTLVVEDVAAAGEALVVARALGGRPLPALPLDDPAAARAMLRACWVDLDVALPSIEGDLRRQARSIAEDLGVFAAHHVVEVDPRPGLLGFAVADRSLSELSVAATGVLAGRVAAAARSWR